MIVNFVFICCVMVLTSAEPFLYRISGGKGKFLTSKSKLRFYIAHGQCSGHISLTNVCHLTPKPEAFRVTVKDNMGFPDIVIDKELENVNIFRRNNDNFCYGMAHVTLKYNCLNEDVVNNKMRNLLSPVLNISTQFTDTKNHVRQKRETSLPYYKLPDIIVSKQISNVNRDLQDASADANPFSDNNLVRTNLLADLALNNVITLEKKITDESSPNNKVSKAQDNSSLPSHDVLDLKIMENPLVNNSKLLETKIISINLDKENVTSFAHSLLNSSVVNISSTSNLSEKGNLSLSDLPKTSTEANSSTASYNSTSLDEKEILSNSSIQNKMNLQNHNLLNKTMINNYTDITESLSQNLNVSLTTLANNVSSHSRDSLQTSLFNSTERSVNLSNKTM